jgi:hypothetical protein
LYGPYARTHVVGMSFKQGCLVNGFRCHLSSPDAGRWFNTVSVTEGYDYTFAFRHEPFLRSDTEEMYMSPAAEWG